MASISTGWRALAPALVQGPHICEDQDKKELFQCKQMAAKALALKTGTRALLDALVSFYGGEPVRGRLLVWPANKTLSERTGLSERALRVCMRNLITLGLVSAKESANGKRFAVRSKSGQIIDAFGIDLGPLIARQGEFAAMVEELEILAERRSRAFDEVTINRRATREALRTITHWFPETKVSDLEIRFETLSEALPRRDSSADPAVALQAWSELRHDAEQRYEEAACGGKNSRDINTDNDSPDQSCQRASSRMGSTEEPTLANLALACPDAISYAGKIASGGDLAHEAGRLRGAFGVHVSAWEEAVMGMGAAAAAATFFTVLQIYEDDQKSGGRIANFGGYFRAFARKVVAGEIRIGIELERLRHRHRQ